MSEEMEVEEYKFESFSVDMCMCLMTSPCKHFVIRDGVQVLMESSEIRKLILLSNEIVPPHFQIENRIVIKRKMER